LLRAGRLARQAEADGRWDDALTAWKLILEPKPGDRSAYLGVKRCLLATSRFDEALTFFKSMEPVAGSGSAGIDPLTIAVDRVEVLFTAGREKEADAALENTLTDWYGNPDTYADLSRVLISLRQGDRGLNILRRGRRECGDPHLFAREIAQYSEARMDWDTAVREYLLDVEAEPDRLNYIIGAIGDIAASPGGDSIAVAIISQKLKERLEPTYARSVRKLLASLAFRARRYGEALEQYQELDRLGDPGQELLIFAQLLFSEGEFRLAWQAYNLIITRNPFGVSAAGAWMGKGDCADRLGEIDSARAAYSSALDAKPTPDAAFEAYRHLGELEFDHGDPARARSFYDSALKLGGKAGLPPERLDPVRVSAALGLAKQGDSDRAEAELKKVIGDKPTRTPAAARARMELAWSAFRRGDLTNAQNYATALTTSDPASEFANEALELVALLSDLKGSPEALQAIGRAERERFYGRPDAAAGILDSLTADEGRIGEEALWRLFQLKRETGKSAEALIALESIISLKNAALRIDLALLTAGELCETELKKPAQAAEFYERLLVDYPDSPLADQARKRLKAIESSPQGT